MEPLSQWQTAALNPSYLQGGCLSGDLIETSRICSKTKYVFDLYHGLESQASHADGWLDRCEPGHLDILG